MVNKVKLTLFAMLVIVIAQTASAHAQNADYGLFTQFIGNYRVIDKECRFKGSNLSQIRFNDLVRVEFEAFGFRASQSVMINFDFDSVVYGTNLVDILSFGRTTMSENSNSASMIEYHPPSASTYGREYVNEIKMTKDLTTPGLYVLNYFEKVEAVGSIEEVDCSIQLQKIR
ncbi:MAG: hypothetical protein QE271_09205 [Bacteriovoracaceae bacterium]|nr:hypothetical protein [Bacteriovoracaceae bacterium]